MRRLTTIAMVLLVAPFAMAEGDQQKAPTFTLEDPHKKSVKVSFPREKPLFLSLADREGSEEIPGWAKPIKDAYGDQIEHIGVADLNAIPGLMRGPIRMFFRSVEGYVLMDWDGEVCKQYGVKAKTALIVVVDRDGGVLAREEGAADDARVDAMKEVLGKYLGDGAESVEDSE